MSFLLEMLVPVLVLVVAPTQRPNPGLNCPHYCTRIVLDPAGEQGPEYKAGEYKLRQHGIEVVWKHTATDKRSVLRRERSKSNGKNWT